MKNLRKHLKYIFPLLVIIMIAGLIFSRIHRPRPSVTEPDIQITAKEASEYIGSVAKVCGQVASARFLPEVGGNPAFLNFGQPHPNQFFTAVIWGNQRNKWDIPPEQFYLNKEICVSGLIETHEGKPQIIVEKQAQIEVQVNH